MVICQSSQWSGPAGQARSFLLAGEVAATPPGSAAVVAVDVVLSSAAKTSLVAVDVDGTAMGSSPPASAAPATIADPPVSVAVNATPAIARNTTLLVYMSFPF